MFSETSEKNNEEAIATAPGDIPLPEVDKRVASLAYQFRHDNTIRPLAPKPNEPVEVKATSGIHVDIARAEVWYTTDGSLPDQYANRLPLTVLSIDWQAHAGYLTHWQAVIPGQGGNTTVRYCLVGWCEGRDMAALPDFRAMDGQGFWFREMDQDNISTFAYYVEANELAGPQWMKEAIIYHIFLDRYHPGTADGRFPENQDPQGRHGGTIRGVTQTLPYLVDLGINCIWLSPINISETYHRYDASDFFQIDPELGSKEDLKQLITQAHDKGIRVILDFVPSHCSWQHPAFVAAKADRNAPTASWFVFKEWPHHYRCFMGMVSYLPSFDTNDLGARQHLIESATYWLTDFDMDGFRLDHAIGHGMDFWVQFRTAVEAAKPEAVTIGEVTDSPDALRHYKGRISHILDFPLAQALRLTFATNGWHVAQLDSFLQTYDRFMADGPGRASFLDNHDMNRFLFIAGGNVNRLKMAAVCQFTLSPTPILYYGTEIGLSQAKDKDEEGYGGDHHIRLDMPWDKTTWHGDLLTFYQQLIRLRLAKRALQSGRRQRTHLDSEAQTYAYLCSDDAAAEKIWVVFNLSAAAQILPLPASVSAVEPVLTTSQVLQLESDHIVLAAETAVILTAASS